MPREKMETKRLVCSGAARVRSGSQRERCQTGHSTLPPGRRTYLRSARGLEDSRVCRVPSSPRAAVESHGLETFGWCPSSGVQERRHVKQERVAALHSHHSRADAVRAGLPLLRCKRLRLGWEYPIAGVIGFHCACPSEHMARSVCRHSVHRIRVWSRSRAA
jgi:hypothetical protein